MSTATAKTYLTEAAACKTIACVRSKLVLAEDELQQSPGDAEPPISDWITAIQAMIEAIDELIAELNALIAQMNDIIHQIAQHEEQGP
jgi:phage-related minor tail protein